MVVEARRRLSAFRPRNWAYPPAPPAKLSLEQLPLSVLIQIAEQLPTQALLALCVTCKYLYLPSAAYLYRKIIVTDDTMALAYARDHLNEWGRACGTAVRTEKLERLVLLLERSCKLASLVRTVYLENGARQEKNLEAQAEKVGAKQRPQDVCDLLVRLLACTRPTDVYVNLPEIRVLLPNAVCLACPAPVFLAAKSSHLAEICLCGDWPADPAAVATALVDAPLRTLAFRTVGARDLRRLNLLNTSERTSPPWINILSAVAPHRLQLQALELDGHVRDSASAAQTIASAVALEDLTSLLLRCTEQSPGAHVPHEPQATLVYRLTRHTLSLSSLSLRPTDNCLACQEQSIVQTLEENLRGQLEHLVLFFESSGSIGAETVRRAVLASQPALKRLECRDPTTLGEARAHLYTVLDQDHISQWEHGSFYEQRIRRTFFPNDFGTPSPQFVPDPLARCLEECAPAVAQYLARDTVYGARPPRLVEYSVVDFTVAVQRNALIVNGRDIPLDVQEAETQEKNET